MTAIHAGWIADRNRFGLEKPPDWFLTGLLEYDEQLVIIPSQKRRQYLLCRRRKLTAGLGDVAMLDNKHPDTNMCYAHGVLPIAPLRWKKTQTDAGMFTQQNLTSLIATLRERDAWLKAEQLGVGGGPNLKAGHEYAVADDVDLFDEEQERRQDKQLRDNFYHMGRDAWRSLQARMGWRNKRASDFHGVARPQTSGGVILTDAR